MEFACTLCTLMCGGEYLQMSSLWTIWRRGTARSAFAEWYRIAALNVCL